MAVALNVTFDQGANNSFQINVTNSGGDAVDLTAYTANAYMKKHTESVNSVSLAASGEANGLMTVSMNVASSSNTAEGQYYYWVKIEHNTTGVTTRIQEGILTLKGE